MVLSILVACVSLLSAPIKGVIVEPYREPACAYCAGHRGVSVAVADGAEVRAIADGVITFAGEVAGTLYVVLQFAPNFRLTYGGLRDRLSDSGAEINTGDEIKKGAVLGHVGTRVYLGVRRGVDPVSPLPFIGVRRSRLVRPDAPRCHTPFGIYGQSR